MASLLKEQLSAGGATGTVYIEVDEAPAVRQADAYESFGGSRGPTEAIAGSFESGMALIRQCSEAVVASVAGIATAARPSEVEVSFGVKFASEVGAFVAKSGLDASLSVKLKWVSDKR